MTMFYCHSEPPYCHSERSEESKISLLGLLRFSTTRPVRKDLRFFGVRASE